MEKSKHAFTISGGIPEDELKNFINPIKVLLDIDRGSFYRIFNNQVRMDIHINRFYTEIFKYLPSMPEAERDDLINNYCTLTYVPHTSEYDFRLHPISFVNTLFKYMKINYEVPFINFDNEYGINYFKDYVNAYIDDFYRDPVQKTMPRYFEKCLIINDLKNNLGKIADMYYISLDYLITNNVVAKNMLLYLAFKGLSEYERTNDEKYLVLPCEYYHYVSHMQTSPYPKSIVFEGYSNWYPDFRYRYNYDYKSNNIIDDTEYLINDTELLLAWDILTPGMVERELRDINQRHRANPNVDYEKYKKLFETKMNFYMSSPYVNYIKGKYGMLGYVGFSYLNDYLLFDKFHNSDTIDPADRTILTHGEAIYALPADRFDVLKGNKQRVIAAKKSDSRIIKINHTPNNSYLDKMDNIIKGPNLSTMTFDAVIAREKKRILILNKKH